MLTILSFILSGLSAYLLFRLDTADRWAAFAQMSRGLVFFLTVWLSWPGHANGFLFFF